MTKQEFLKKLQAKLKGLPKREIGERINFYSETIDDRIEEGLSEEEAVLAVGSVDEIAYQIAEEIHAVYAEEGKMPKRKLRAWEIVLLTLGSPLWIALLIVAFAVAITVYAVIWTVNLCIWAVELPFYIFSWISKGLFFVCKKTTEWAWYLTKQGCVFVKKFFGKKE